MVKPVDQTTSSKQLKLVEKEEVSHKGYNWKKIRCCSTLLVTKSLMIGTFVMMCLLSLASAEENPTWTVGCGQTYRSTDGHSYSSQNGLNTVTITKNSLTQRNIIKPFLNVSSSGVDRDVSCELYQQLLVYEGNINDFVFTPPDESSASFLDIPSMLYLIALGVLFIPK